MTNIDTEIRTQDPSYSWMLDDPELRYILIANFQPHQAFDTDTIQNEILQTNWWKTHSASQRDWARTVAEDPASAEQQMNRKIGDLQAAAAQANIQLSSAQLRWAASTSLQNNYNTQQDNQQLVQIAGAGAPINSQAVKQLAAAYALPMSDQAANMYAQGMFSGNLTTDSLKDTFAKQAQSAYGTSNPGLANALSQGTSVRDYMDPQIQAVATTLEQSPTQVDLLSPKYSALLNYTDKSGTLRAMTVPEAQVWARSQDEYQQTSQGKQAGADMVQQLAQTFGKTSA